MRRVLKWLRRVLTGVVVIVVLGAIAVAFVLNTQSGTRWIIHRIDAAIPGEITIEQFDGTLWAGLHIPTFVYRDAGREVRATGADLNVSWSSVVAGRLTLDVADAQTVEYRGLGAPDSSPSPFELAMKPLPVTLGIIRSRIGNFVLIASGNRTEIGDIHVDHAYLNGDALRAETVSAVVENVAIEATQLAANLSGDVPLSLGITWSLTDDTWSGGGTVGGSLVSLDFDHVVSGPYPASASGKLALLHRIVPEVDAVVVWAQWSFGDYVLDDGQVQVRGTADNYDAQYELNLQVRDLERIRLSGTAAGSTEQLTAFEVNVSNSTGNADLTGSMMWRPSFVAEARVRASDIDPSTFVEKLSGRLAANAHVRIDGGGNLDISNAIVSGVLNDAPIDARGNVALRPEQLSCDGCLVAVGDNRISIDGSSGRAGLALNLAVDAPSLDLLWPNLAGSLSGKGLLSGSRTLPQFTGDLHGQQLRFADWSATDIVVVSQASTADAVNLVATISALLHADTDLGSFAVVGKGAPESPDLEIDWTYRDLKLNLAGNVQQRDEYIEGLVTRAVVVEPNTGSWSLTGPTGFRIRGSDLLVDRHTWSNMNGQFRVAKFSRTGDELALTATLVGLPLQVANTFLPPNFALQGSASADIDVIQESGTWSGSVHWRQADTILSVIEVGEQSTDVAITRAEFDAELRDGGATISAALTVEPGVTGELDLALSRFSSDSPIVAEMRLNGNDWYWMPAVVPTIDKFEGAISATVRATGPLTAPEFSGNLNWRDGSLAVPALNVPINDIDLTISGRSDGAATMAGSAKASEGELGVTGRFANLTRSTRSVELTLNGKGAEVVNWPEYHLWASPNLVITGSSAGWTVNGQLEVPRADIAVRELPEEAIMPSPDVIVLGREEEPVTPTRISGEARLVLGDRVRVQAFGLDTGLKGELLIRVAQDRPLSAEGQVTLVDGEFSAYGQKLTIQQGTLTFTGPLDNPIVDVRAVRIIEAFEGSVTAGIHLQGRAQSISSSVFSDPAMSEADALSYLVVGRPLNQATESEGNELSNAALALGVRQATQVTEQIGQSLGLDQLALAGDGGDTTALVAGKQLNARLHARYAYGVFSRLGTLLLRYKMSRRLTLEAGAGEIQSINILYSVEKQ